MKRYPDIVTYQPVTTEVVAGEKVSTNSGEQVVIHCRVSKATKTGIDFKSLPEGDLAGLSHELHCQPLGVNIPKGATLTHTDGQTFKVLDIYIGQKGIKIWLSMV